MEWIMENWYLCIVAVAILVAVGFAIYKFAGLPTKEQIIKVKKLLLYWVILAESELGGGVGQIKLRYVFDLFSAKFPVIAKLITFEKFSGWVDDALEELEELLKTNESVNELVNGVVEVK